MQVEVASEMVQECIKKWKTLIRTRDSWTADELDEEFGRIWISEHA
jgi:hypothetical protein